MAAAISDRRFIPHVVLHEFETWVIAAAVGSNRILDDEGIARCLLTHAAEVGNDVELLDDGPQTAPSKRVLQCWPEYQKVVDGIAVITERGLEQVMGCCPVLSAWIDQLT